MDDAPEFAQFFSELHGYGPFPWQAKLTKEVSEGTWPRILKLPTSSGKTAVIDVAIFALACQSDLPASERTAPRRILFVVDRRIIVDEAFERAKKIARELKSEKGGDACRWVAAKLQALAGDQDSDPLACFQLRGGIYQDPAWVNNPAQPTVLTSTVDQAGSRMLFRGYGVSENMAPIHAGLFGNDTLVILDEAHCSRPFSRTLEAIEDFRSARWTPAPIPAPFSVVQMSATPPGDVSAFELTDADRENGILNKRFGAKKPARLQLISSAKGKDAPAKFAKELASLANQCREGGCASIAVIVNRVATARSVYEWLSNDQKDADVELVIGRMRPIDRDRLNTRLLFDLGLKSGVAGGEDREKPVFVVATQTLEVGADLDFDGLVTECASIDALRQRFGRINRTGQEIEVKAWIAAKPADLSPKDPDPIYGDALKNTWAWLCQVASDDGVDFGVDAMDALASRTKESDLAGMSMPNLEAAPTLLPAHLDLLAQTSPKPAIEPDIALYLHGKSRGVPEINLIWRSDLPDHLVGRQRRDLWTEIVSLCPPSSAEALAAPLHRVREWLTGDMVGRDETSDVTAERTPDERRENKSIPQEKQPLIWQGLRDSKLAVKEGDLQPGATVVISDTQEGWDHFGHFPEGWFDAGDQGFAQSRDRGKLRIHEILVRDWTSVSLERNGEPDFTERFRNACKALREGTQDAVAEFRGILQELLQALPENSRRRPLIEGYLNEPAAFRVEHYPNEAGAGVVLTTKKRQSQSAELEPLDGSDISNRKSDSVSLHTHNTEVAVAAKKLGKQLGLSEAYQAALEFSGAFHDTGKADPRFQAMLHGGDAVAARFYPELLAKSEQMPDSYHAYRTACRRSGLPDRFRHELLSTRLAESSAALTKHAFSDLILHLITSHHGRCRPFAPVVVETSETTVALDHDGEMIQTPNITGLERLDSGIADRFWSLSRKHGWWGLAYLEAILRLADHEVSRRDPN